jgi:hypothetical protein
MLSIGTGDTALLSDEQLFLGAVAPWTPFPAERFLCGFRGMHISDKGKEAQM